jgi:hypothetical protein
MIFRNARSGGNKNVSMQFIRPVRNVVKQKVIVKEDTQIVENKNLYIWGASTWYLFHTMAEKIKDDFFLQKRKEILDLIFLICSNLPCPICSEHAKTYLNSINFNNIQTKQGLKRMLLDFHNNVNSRKHYSLFNISQLKMYESAKINNILQYFLNNFLMKTNSIQYAHITMRRNMIKREVKKWFDTNIKYFNT